MALWTPAELETALWLDAADSSTLTIESGNVREWRDKSERRGYASGPAGYSPERLSATLNGQAVVEFNGVNEYFSMHPPLPIQADLSWFQVFQRPAAAINTFTLCSPVNGGYPYAPYWFTNNVRYSGLSASVDVLHGPASTATGYFLWSWVRNSTHAELWQGGVSVDGAKTVGPVANADHLAYFGRRGATSTVYTRGQVGEIIVLHAAAVATRQTVEGYLAHKWGLSGALPADHPYKTAAPTVAEVTIGGNVTKAGGGPAETVALYHWNTRALAQTLTPASNGDWTTSVRPGQYGISYFAADCQPITHGPYTFTVP